MQQNDGRTVAHDRINNLGVPTTNAIHAGDCKACRSGLHPDRCIQHSLRRRNLLRVVHDGHLLRFFRHDDPRHDVRDHAKKDGREERDYQP